MTTTYSHTDTSYYPVVKGGARVHCMVRSDLHHTDYTVQTVYRLVCRTQEMESPEGLLVQANGTEVTCKHCLATMELMRLNPDLSRQVEPEALTEQLAAEATEEPGTNEFTLHYLFNLPDSTETRKEWRKLVRDIIKAQAATYVIEDGHYTVTLPSGFVYSFSRDDSGATYIDLEASPA